MGKKMLSTNVVESDAFMDMPLTAQALYMHLNMNADNDGFVNPKKIVRMTGAAHDDLQILIAKRFLIYFDSGVVVIKHWWINNTKRTDRYAPTTYQNELSELVIKNNNSYSKNIEQIALETPTGMSLATSRQEFLPQHNITQHNINQHKAPQKTGFKKTIKTKEQKRAYAIASQADRDQEARVTESVNERKGSKGYNSFMKAGDIFKNKEVKAER